jgi:hypothetical protein
MQFSKKSDTSPDSVGGQFKEIKTASFTSAEAAWR